MNPKNVANCNLLGRTQHVSGGIDGNGIAAFEDTQRAALFKLQTQTIQTFALDAEEALRSRAQGGGAFFQAQAKGGYLVTKIKRYDAHMRGSETPPRSLQIGA